MRRIGPILLAILALAGCTHGSERAREPTDAVLYTIGLSTDPYGESSPQGFGVVTGVRQGTLDKVEIRERGLGSFGGAEWLDNGLVVVPRPAPPLLSPLIFRYDGKLKRHGTAPIPGGSGFAWTPHQKLFAYEPSVACRQKQQSLFACSRASGRLFVVRADGTGRKEITAGHLMGWTADGELAFFKSFQRAIPRAIDLKTGAIGAVAPGWKAGLPIWSPDRRYFAAVAGGGVVVGHADGRVVQTIRTKLVVSMIAWAPVAQRLAYTTSGFPDPHEVFVLESPRSKPRRLYDAGPAHFDWITWSPDGTRLLLDDYGRGRWLLLRTKGAVERRVLPELGGRPLWCCPVNAYSAGGTVRNS